MPARLFGSILSKNLPFSTIAMLKALEAACNYFFIIEALFWLKKQCSIVLKKQCSIVFSKLSFFAMLKDAEAMEYIFGSLK